MEANVELQDLALQLHENNVLDDDDLVRKTLLIFPQDDRFYYVCVLKNREFLE